MKPCYLAQQSTFSLSKSDRICSPALQKPVWTSRIYTLLSKGNDAASYSHSCSLFLLERGYCPECQGTPGLRDPLTDSVSSPAHPAVLTDKLLHGLSSLSFLLSLTKPWFPHHLTFSSSILQVGVTSLLAVWPSPPPLMGPGISHQLIRLCPATVVWRWAAVHLWIPPLLVVNWMSSWCCPLREFVHLDPVRVNSKKIFLIVVVVIIIVALVMKIRIT